MSDKVIETNMVTIVGTINSSLVFSHEMFGEGFYNFELKVHRLSEHSDILPITISERLLVGVNMDKDNIIKVEGQLRSYNKYVDGSNKLVLTIFARDMGPCMNEEEINNPNQIYLDGFICKRPIYRTTPFGREITDMLLAVNRPYNKSDYIPCIAWGRNARFSEKLEVGDHIKVWGRVQSRDYQKKISDEKTISKTAFEVSISKMENHEDKNNKE
jgi:primosomal replication protein N